ncbi:MAG: 30S ribosomal protein S6 [Armatimonadota bacterium]|nr:30S ribosomal protein S6 [bacterium]
MNTTKRNYEALYIVDATLTDEQIEPIVSKYSTLVADQGGEIQAHAKWDKRRLAYEIKGRREGIYILMYFTGEPNVEKELDRVFRISDEVIRHIILRVEPQYVDTSYVERARVAPEPAAVVAEAPQAPETPEAAPEAAEEPAEQAAEAVEAPVEEAPAAEEATAE